MSKLGVVLVSHSADIAKGLKDIVDEMNDGSVTVMAAGGADEGRIGTSAVKIMEAMEALADNDYILVYADLGSSIMSAETAVEMLEEEVAGKIRMVPSLKAPWPALSRAVCPETWIPSSRHLRQPGKSESSNRTYASNAKSQGRRFSPGLFLSFCLIFP